jgi:aerobic C4-dicarboxylate transport protein
LALLLGVDRFMSEARALTNLVGNGVATIVVSKWEKALDQGRAEQVLSGQLDVEQELEGAVTRPAPAE